jgi:Flp pilus assembly protein protease CpaA
MSSVVIASETSDTRRSLAQIYRRVQSVPLAFRLVVGSLGPIIAAAICYLAHTPPAAGLLVWLLVVSVVSDLLWRRIFNWITGPAFVAVVLAQIVGLIQPDLISYLALPDWQTSLAGFGLCFGIMLLLYFTFQGGEGDVKIVSVFGAILGPREGIEVMMGAYILAAIVAVTILAYRFARRVMTGQAPDRPFTAGTLPMAPFFALAALIVRPAFGGL